MQALGLTPIGMRQCAGVSGVVNRPVYFVRLVLALKNSAGGGFLMANESPMTGVRDMELVTSGLLRNGAVVPFVGLLGRDFLRLGVLLYGGSEGRFEVWIDHNPTPAKAKVKP